MRVINFTNAYIAAGLGRPLYVGREVWFEGRSWRILKIVPHWAWDSTKLWVSPCWR